MIVKCQNAACDAALRFNEQAFDAPAVQVACPKCGHKNVVKLPKNIPADPEGPPAWLIVHDEQAPPQRLALREGLNRIGRQGSAPGGADVAIQSADRYMSRLHCSIELKAEGAGRYALILRDAGSTNGTFLNAAPQRLHPDDAIFLYDGDILQLGRTKVILQTAFAHRDIAAAHAALQQQPYARTIIA